MTNRILRLAAATITAVATAAGVLAAPVAGAQTGSLESPERNAFYATPADLGTANGQVLRTQPMVLAATVPGLPAPWQTTDARKILYRSVGAAGHPIAVSGTYLRSSVPWTGPGPRPLASIAPGTEGQGDQCAPSKSFENGLNLQATPPGVGAGYELLSAWTMLSRGFDVVVTDYEGLGTEGVHTYVDRASGAHTVLDAARAALNLPGTELRPDSPVVISGHSQGGGATAAAAELQPEYAPELHVAGAVASAPPADLMETLHRVDGNAISGVVGYALNGFVYSRPELGRLIDPHLSPQGRGLIRAISGQCIAETIFAFGLRSSRELTTDGRSASEVLSGIPEVMAVLDDQRIGRRRPAAPVRVATSRNDDTIPTGQVVTMARDWCGRGATVELAVDELPPILPGAVIPNHLGPMMLHLQDNADYLLDRVHGVPAPNACGTF